MTHPPQTQLWRRRLAASLAATAVFAVLPAPAAAGAAPHDAPTINTYPDWDGGSYFGFMGHPSGSTLGQSITIPRGKSQLDKFRFSVHPLDGEGGVMKYRAEVYGWDGTRATTEVWESKRRTLDLATIDNEPAALTFRVPGAAVEQRQQYVLFLTVSKDYRRTAPYQWVYFSGMPMGHYAGGEAVRLADSGHPSWWTTHEWSTSPDDWDLAMKVWLS